MSRSLAQHLLDVRPVGDQTSSVGKFAINVHVGQTILERKISDQLAMDQCECLTQHNESIRTVSTNSSKRALNVVCVTNFEPLTLHADFPGRRNCAGRIGGLCNIFWIINDRQVGKAWN